MAITSDGGSTSYYDLPKGATELNDLIEHKRMSFALGNIFKACYRLGEKNGSDALYDLRKIVFFANRLIALEEKNEEAKKEQYQKHLELLRSQAIYTGSPGSNALFAQNQFRGQ